MISEPSFEQRQRDRRLAWLIVGVCAAVTLALLVLLLTVATRYAEGWLTAEQRQREQAARDLLDENPPLPPISTTSGPPPLAGDVAPIGSPAAWIGPDDYPAGARRDGEEGRVRVTVAVDPEGQPTGCQTFESSGSWSLDSGTCHVFLSKGRFTAASPGETGVRKWTSPPVRWQLPE